MVTYYPTEHEEFNWQVEALESRIKELERQNSELNISWMKTQAELSDAEDTVRRWRTELEIVASKGEHNGCHIWIPDLLKRTLGHTGKFLDPEKMTSEQFAEGCIVFHGDRFPDCGIRLEVVKIVKISTR